MVIELAKPLLVKRTYLDNFQEFLKTNPEYEKRIQLFRLFRKGKKLVIDYRFDRRGERVWFGWSVKNSGVYFGSWWGE
jgi:hypothetical protein